MQHDRNLPASVGPSKQPLQHSPQSRDVNLLPATPTRAVAELGACLSLVAPTGMNGDDRTEWLKVAQMTLSDLPADLLARGCEKARRTCDHPSKVVPCILEEVEFAMRRRQEMRTAMYGARRDPIPHPRLPDPQYVDPAELTKLLASLRGAAHG